MQDPIQGHPTRAEQLDILAEIVAGTARPGDALLDLGCGTGYVARLILSRCPGLDYTGVDLNAGSLAAAAENLADLDAATRFVEADLSRPGDIAGADGPYRFAVSALAFHDLADAQKRHLLRWSAERLAPDGFVLVYDRLRLDAGALYPLQQAIWRRIERIHGRGMRTAEDFAAYRADLGPKNRPAALADYLAWFADIGFAAQPLHIHGNVALIAAAREAAA